MKLFNIYKLSVVDVYNSGDFEVDDNLRDKQKSLLLSWHAFRPDELIKLIEKNNCKINNLVSPATLARFVDKELLIELFKKEKEYREYLKFEKKFDSDQYLLGVGTIGVGGLLAVIGK